MRPKPGHVGGDEGRDVGVAAAAAMALHADDLAPGEDGEPSARARGHSRWYTMLVSCIAMGKDPDMPRPCADGDFSAECTPGVRALLDAWNTAPHTPVADEGDELLQICFGEDTLARAALIDKHMHGIDQLLSTIYPEYTSNEVFKHSSKALMTAVRSNPDMLSLHVAIIFFALAEETSVHKYFAGINEDGTCGGARVNSERYNRFVRQLRAATDKLLTQTPPCTNPFIYAHYCAYFYVGCGSPQSGHPTASHS
jgi:hypothetical protein